MTIQDPTAIPETQEQATEYLREADDLWSNNRREEAVTLYWSVIQSQYETALPDNREGEIMFRVGETAEAHGDLDRALRAYYWGRGLHHEASAQAYDRLMGSTPDQEIDPSVPPATVEDAIRYTTAAREAAATDPERAVALYNAIMESAALSPGHLGQMALEVGKLHQQGNSHDAAYQMFRLAASTGSDDVRGEATQLLAQYHRQDGSSLDDLSTSGSPTDEADAERYLQATAEAYDRGDTSRAEALGMIVISSNVASNGQKGGAHFYLGATAYYAHNYDVARTHLTNASENADEPYRGWAQQMLEYRWQEN